MRFKAGEVAKDIASDVSEKHGSDARETEKCLMSRCLREVTRTMAEQRDNPCHPAVMNRHARANSRDYREELREEHGPFCAKQCKQYMKQDSTISEDDCFANCTYFKATRDQRYDTALDKARFRASAECAVANHWNTLAKCMIKTCGLDVPKPGKPRKPIVELR